MEYSQALSYARAGEAVFITGSGFSIEARNILGETLFTGNELRKDINKLVGLDEDTPLDICSQEYIDSIGEHSFIDYLKKHFEVKEYSSFYNVFAKIPELKIYTTNYDNLIETVCDNEKKKIKSYELYEKVNKANKKNLVMHLNGCIENLHDMIPNTFNLTHLSYNNPLLYDSPWYPYLKDELRSSKVVFIIGLSFKSDLNLRRLIYSEQEIIEKCFIIESSTLSDNNRSFLSKYGHVIQSGIKRFCEDLNNAEPAKNDYNIKKYKFRSFKKIESGTAYSGLTDKEMYDMFILGKFDKNAFYRDEYGKFVSIVNRSKISTALDCIDKGKSIIIHSDLGNGKTIFLNQLIYQIKDKIIFNMCSNYNDKLQKEIELLCSSNEKVIIVIDPYNSYLNDFEKFKNYDLTNIQFILIARTAMHENCSNILYEITDQMKLQNADFSETPINLNVLDKEELTELNNIISSYGFWGEHANLSDEQKLRFLTKDLKGRFQNILIYIFESKQIKEKFEVILQNISSDKLLFQIIILSFINKILELNFYFDDFSIIFNCDNIDRIIRKRKNELGELIDYSDNQIQVKSSIISKSLISSKQIRKEDILDTLLLVTNRLNNLYEGNKKYREALKNLASASYLSFIFDYQLDSKVLISYYEKIKENRFNKNNLFFWQQYAITCVNIKDFDRAKKYFATSYSLAQKRGQSFSSFQIDNHYARYLLEHQIYLRNYETALQTFVQAHNLLLKKYNKDDLINKRYYQFRVAVLYKEYYDVFYESFNEEDKKMFIIRCHEMYKRLTTYIHNKSDIELRGYIFDCKENLEYIFNNVEK